jgi:hypothetical protein
VPGVISLGTRRNGGIRDVVAVYSHTSALVIDAAGAEFDPPGDFVGQRPR